MGWLSILFICIFVLCMVYIFAVWAVSEDGLDCSQDFTCGQHSGFSSNDCGNECAC